MDDYFKPQIYGTYMYSYLQESISLSYLVLNDDFTTNDLVQFNNLTYTVNAGLSNIHAAISLTFSGSFPLTTGAGS